MRNYRFVLTLCATLFALVAALPLSAQGGGRGASPDTAAIARIKSQYAKTEVRIRARDGTQLFTSIYAPRDTTRTYPILMSRTPYGIAPYGPYQYPARLGPSPRFSNDGYIFVYQDTRGRFMSGATSST